MASITINFNHQQLILNTWPDEINDLLKLRQKLNFEQLTNTQLTKALNQSRSQLTNWQYWMLALLISGPYLKEHHFADLKYINNHLTDYLTYLATSRTKPVNFTLNTISGFTNFFIAHELRTVASPLTKLASHESRKQQLSNLPKDWVDQIEKQPVGLHSTYHLHRYSQHYQDDETVQSIKKDQRQHPAYWSQLNYVQDYYVASTITLLPPNKLNQIIDQHYSKLPDITLEDQAIIKDRINEVHYALTHYAMAKNRWQYVINHRFGLNGQNVMSLQKIGEHLNITRERVRQIEKKILKRLNKSIYLNQIFPEYSINEIENQPKLTLPTTIPELNPARHDYLFYLQGDCLSDPNYQYQPMDHLIKTIN